MDKPAPALAISSSTENLVNSCEDKRIANGTLFFISRFEPPPITRGLISFSLALLNKKIKSSGVLGSANNFAQAPSLKVVYFARGSLKLTLPFNPSSQFFTYFSYIAGAEGQNQVTGADYFHHMV